MGGWLKAAFLWTGALIGIWLAVGATWYWRSYQPTNTDLLLGLLGVPALLVGGYFLLKRVLGSVLQPMASPEASVAMPPRSDEKPAAPGPRVQVKVLGGSVKLPAGGSKDLLQACMDGARPQLDKQLRDAQGYPVLAARVESLEAMEMIEWWDGLGLDPVLPQGREWAERLPEAPARALRLLADVLAESAALLERELSQAAEQLASSSSSSSSSSHTAPSGASDPGVREAHAVATPLPMVKVLLAMGPDWDKSDLNPLQSWAGEWLQQAAPSLRFSVQLYSAESPEGVAGLPEFLWPHALLDPRHLRFSQPHIPGDAQEEVWLLASAHSSISQQDVDSLSATGRLYGPKRRDGWIPGEGAAALALLRHRPEGGTAAFASGLQLPVIAEAVALPAKGAVAADFGEQVVAPLLQACGLPAVKVGRVLSDADQRPEAARGAALLLSQQFPELSLEEDCAMLGLPSGHVGGVAALAGLVLAAEFAVEEESGALAVVQASSQWRAAALVMPHGWTDKAETATPHNKEA